MQALNAALAIGAGAVLLLGVASGYIKNRLWVSEPAICLLIGILIGPAVFNFLGLDVTAERGNLLLKEAARITLAISIMGAALRLPYAYVARHWRELAIVLGLGMPLMWASSTVLAWLILPLPILTAALVGAIVTPTDPVLADTVVSGRVADEAVPSRLTASISAESGANDGLALFFVMLPILLLTKPVGEALTHWLTVVLLWEILFAAVIGAVIGWLAGVCVDWAQRQPFHEPVSVLTVSVALALTVLAAIRLIHSDGILAVFAAGVAFNRFVARIEDPEHERLPEAIGRFFDLPIFIVFGLALPWQKWGELGWGPLVALAVAVLLLRRLPAWFLLRPLLPSVRSTRDTLFNGWFGPIGIAALFYATRANEETGLEGVWAIASLVVFASILVHGITATPLARLYGRRAAAAGDDDDRGREP